MLKEYHGSVPPCGVFCGGCPSYTKEKRPCPGAEISQRCQTKNCPFYQCCQAMKVEFCHQCTQYACKRFKTFARNWKKYGQCFVENQAALKENGAQKFLDHWNDKAKDGKSASEINKE